MDFAFAPGVERRLKMLQQLLRDRTDGGGARHDVRDRAGQRQGLPRRTSTRRRPKPTGDLVLGSHGNDTGWMEIDIDAAAARTVSYAGAQGCPRRRHAPEPPSHPAELLHRHRGRNGADPRARQRLPRRAGAEVRRRAQAALRWPGARRRAEALLRGAPERQDAGQEGHRPHRHVRAPVLQQRDRVAHRAQAAPAPRGVPGQGLPAVRRHRDQPEPDPRPLGPMDPGRQQDRRGQAATHQVPRVARAHRSRG